MLFPRHLIDLDFRTVDHSLGPRSTSLLDCGVNHELSWGHDLPFSLACGILGRLALAASIHLGHDVNRN